MEIKTLRVDFVKDGTNNSSGVVTMRHPRIPTLSRSLDSLPPEDKQKIEAAFLRAYKIIATCFKDL